MAFFRLVLYTSKLNRINQKVIAEKNAAAAISRKEKPKYGWRLKLSHVWIECKRRLNNCLINSNFLKNTAVERFFYRLRRYGSFENYVLKSFLGYIGGFLLTYLLFLFLSIQLNVRLSVATVICCFLGCILTIGLAFSQNIRCIVFLTLPQFFSKRGRQALIAYALILTITGPAKNTLNNMGIMSESLACGQEQLKSAVRQILDVIKKPFVAIKEALKAVIKAVKEVIKKIKEILIKIKRVIMAIIGVIKSVFQFLGRILNLCNKELGTPYQRCERVFEGAITDCQASLGPFFSWTCSIGYLLESVCYIVKPFDLICLLVDFLSNSIIGVVMRKLKIFIRHVKTMFYVKIKFSHSYHFESKSSKSMREIASSIVGEVKTRTKGIVSVFEFFNCAASLFFIFLISRVIYYRYKFLTKERFDNKFLTKNLVDIDLRRAAMEKETIFPLNHRERKKYITIKSIRLLPKEQKQLTEGLAFLMSTALKIGTHMAIDYSLFWIMNLIRKYGKFQSKVQAPNIPTVHIAGEGLLADLLKSVVKSFQPLGISLDIDTVPCLPMPIPPDFDRYIQIASILAVCLLLTIFEPYGLRWRNWILCYYYPRRAKERAVWLYNHILRSRGSFLKFARRQLRRKVLGSEKITKVTCLEYLRSKTNNKCLLLFLGSDKQQACLLCGEVFRKSDKETPIRCQRPGCTAMYCKQCFEDLENICTVCLSPIDYGDMSDFSEERDSSDEDRPIPIKPIVESEGYDSGMTTDEQTEDTEGSTDEYSYGYQEIEKVPSIMSDYKTENSRDVEKQSSPDYVSMQYFDDEIELYSLKTVGLDDKDEGTQFPDDSPSSVESEKKVDIEEALETSSAASSFQKQMADQHLQDDSCSCLTLDTVEETPSKLLIDELKRKLSSMGSERKFVEHPPLYMVQDLKPIPEQTEDEALIQFSSEEEKEESNTVYESTQGSFTSRSHFVKPTVQKSSSSNDIPKDTESSSEEKRFLSDSELSENDVKKLIGKPDKDNKAHIPESSTNSNSDQPTSDSEGETKTNTHSESSSNVKSEQPKTNPPERTLGGEESSVDSEIRSKMLKLGQINPDKKIGSLSNLSPRHIEFIGVHQKNKKKTTESTDTSSEDEKTSPRKPRRKYKSTISTKTSKQDVPGLMKERKSILKADSGSSILTDVRQMQEKVVVPPLNLKSLETRTTSYPSRDPYGLSYGSTPETPKKAMSRKSKKFRRTNKTERRLKGGSNVPMSEIETEKFRQEDSEFFEATSSQTSESQALSSPIYPFKTNLLSSVSSIFSSLVRSDRKSDSTKLDLKYFESSDTSFSPIISGDQKSTSFESVSDDIKIRSLYKEEKYLVSMSTDVSTNQPTVEKSNSIIKSNDSISTKKSVRISETFEDVEESSEEGGETDASSDLSISVQENILGIPRNKSKKKQKIDWKHEREISTEEPEVEPPPPEEKVEDKVDQSVGQESEETEDIPKVESNGSKSKKTGSNHKQKNSEHEVKDSSEQVENVASLNQNASEQTDKVDTSEKFVISEDDSRFAENRSARKCRCCKCKEKLPIVHHSSGDDPNRKILLQTGVDSCTQTSIDRSDRSSQIEFATKTTKDSFSSSVSNKSVSVRCKLKGDVSSNYMQKPEKHCSCSVCSRRRFEEDRLVVQRDSFCDNPCLRMETTNTQSQKKCSLPRKKTIGTVCKPQTRDQVCLTKKPYGRSEEMFPCERLRETMISRHASNESVSSNEESYRDRLGLPYQDNEEYKRLVRELEEKLVARNRERVRKTMKEFEKCSTRNQNLRKPILYDDSSCGEEPILTKIVHLKTSDADTKNVERMRAPSVSPRRRCAVKEVNTVETMQKDIETVVHRVPPRPPKYYYERDPIHWQMDTNSGEWFRVSDVNICDPYDTYEPEPRYSQPVQMSRRRMMERYEEEPHCEDCDDLNRRYGHRYNILSCPRHRLDRLPPRHRKR